MKDVKNQLLEKINQKKLVTKEEEEMKQEEKNEPVVQAREFSEVEKEALALTKEESTTLKEVYLELTNMEKDIIIIQLQQNLLREKLDNYNKEFPKLRDKYNTYFTQICEKRKLNPQEYRVEEFKYLRKIENVQNI